MKYVIMGFSIQHEFRTSAASRVERVTSAYTEQVVAARMGSQAIQGPAPSSPQAASSYPSSHLAEFRDDRLKRHLIGCREGEVQLCPYLRLSDLLLSTFS